MWVEPYKKKFRACERYIDPMTGKRKKVTTIIDKDTKAARKAAEAVLRAKIEEEQSAKNESDITLKELYTLFINNQKESCKESTWIRDKIVLGTAIRIMGEDVIARKLNVRFIDQQLRKTGKANVSLNSYLKLLKRMLRWAYRMDYIKDIAYLDKIPAYPDPEKKLRIEDKYLSSDELRMLLHGMAVKRWALLTEFLALSGLRIGEAMALTNDDIDEYIHVTKTMNPNSKKVLNSPKTDAGYRDVYVQPELEDVIKRIRAFVREYNFRYGYRNDLFLSEIEYNAYRKYLEENSAAILQHKITPHALRHTHVSLLAEQGYPLDAISRRVGHRDSEITREIYLHITDKQKEKDNAQLRKIKILCPIPAPFFEQKNPEVQ